MQNNIEQTQALLDLFPSVVFHVDEMDFVFEEEEKVAVTTQVEFEYPSEIPETPVSSFCFEYDHEKKEFLPPKKEEQTFVPKSNTFEMLKYSTVPPEGPYGFFVHNGQILYYELVE